jgi:hypothetical protein
MENKYIKLPAKDLNLYEINLNDLADILKPFAEIKAMIYKNNDACMYGIVIETENDPETTYMLNTVAERDEFLIELLNQAIEWYQHKLLHGGSYNSEDNNYYNYKIIGCQVILRDKLGVK